MIDCRSLITDLSPRVSWFDEFAQMTSVRYSPDSSFGWSFFVVRAPAAMTTWKIQEEPISINTNRPDHDLLHLRRIPSLRSTVMFSLLLGALYALAPSAVWGGVSSNIQRAALGNTYSMNVTDCPG